MSFNNKNGYSGIYRPHCSYSRLDKTWKYSCPNKNPNYPDFSNGNNCLCTNTTKERTSFDKAMINGHKWPVSNNTLGWK